MSYSACDFTDDVFNALQQHGVLTAKDHAAMNATEDDDFPSRCEIALAALRRYIKKVDATNKALFTLSDVSGAFGGTASMTFYTIRVSDHPEAYLTPASQAAAESWQTVHDGPMDTDAAAKSAALELAQHYRFVQVFKGSRDLGRLWLYIPPAIPRNQPELEL